MAFRILLAVLGRAMWLASRTSARFRSQLSRDVEIEIRADDGVARRFVFAGRRASTRAGRGAKPDLSLSFATAAQGFRILTAKDGPTQLYDGLAAGTVRIEGRSSLLGWFQGIVAAAIPGTPHLKLPATPPGAYVTPSSSAEVSRFITREPPARELDPTWTDAAKAREKLVMSAAARGEKPDLF